MKMSSTVRKVALTLHVVCSAGWLGAAAAYLAVAIAALASSDSATMRASYPTLELLGWSVIVPLCGAALLSGIVQSLGTHPVGSSGTIGLWQSSHSRSRPPAC